MNWFLRKLYGMGFCFDTPDEGGGAPATPAKEGEAPAEEQPEGEKPEEAPVVDLNTINQTLQSMTTKIQELEGKLTHVSPASPAAPATVVDDIDKEIQLRKEQLAAIERGEVDAKYRPEVMARLTSAQIKKESREILSHETGKGDFLANWNASLAQAYEEYPELKDKNSELHKLAAEIVAKDPGYRQYLEVIRDKSGAKKFNFESMDPRVNIRAAREAAAILQKKGNGKPKTQGLAKTQLEGKTSVVVQESDLTRLEKEAQESGDPAAWQRLIKARDQHLKSKKTA